MFDAKESLDDEYVHLKIETGLFSGEVKIRPNLAKLLAQRLMDSAMKAETIIKTKEGKIAGENTPSGDGKDG